MVQVNEGSLFKFNYPGIDTAYITDMAKQVQVTMYDVNCRVGDWNSVTNSFVESGTNYGQMGIITSPTVKTAETKAFDMISLEYNNTDYDTSDGTGNLQFTFKTVSSEMAKLSALTPAPPIDNISEMKFCVRFGLYAGDGREMNHEEMIVTLSTTLNGDFDVSTNVGAKEIEETTTTQTYKVDAILCPGQPPVFNQGALISICLSPDEQGLKDSIVLTSVDSFTWEQDVDRIPGNGNEISQSAVNEDPLVAKNTASGVLSDITVQDDQKQIIVRSILYARFFVDVGTVVAFGSCTLAFDTTRNRNRNRNRRLVRGNNSDRNNNKQRTRNLQEQENIYDGSFGVNVDVVPVNDGPVFYEAQTAGGTGLSFTTSVAVVVAATVGIAIMILE